MAVRTRARSWAGACLRSCWIAGLFVACADPAAVAGDKTGADVVGADQVTLQDVATTDAAIPFLDAPVLEASALLDFVAIDQGAAADAAVAPGSFGAPCQANAECDSGFCIPGPAGKFCTMTCVENCPKGYACAATGSSGDVNFICVARWQFLCDPCSDHAACVDPLLGAGAQCLSYGSDGSFCGSPCKKEEDCPSGHVCSGEPGPGGALVGQCRRTSGLCGCSANAKASKLSTTCGHESPFGVCKGIRGCTDQGLSPCSAGIAKAETCNGKDDDCDGATDDAIATAPCVASNTSGICTGATSCEAGKTACSAKVPAKESCNGLDDNCNGETDDAACNDGNPCTEDACNLGVGGCVFAQVTKPCNDGDVCTTSDTCKAGACVGDGVVCSDGDPCTTDTCAAKASTPGCQFAPAPGASCQDGDPCTASDACLAGNGAKLTCTGLALAEGATCTDGNACTLAAACTGGKCKATATACSDGNPCTDDSCDGGAGGACKHFYNIAACDDGNGCTLGDSCFAGKCLGLGKTPCDDADPCTADTCDPKAGGCAHAPKLGAGCTDGDLCTTGDVCAIVGGKSACKGGALQCDDGKTCTSDACNPAFGCEHVFVVAPCDDGDKCTKGDNCQAGQCLAGEYTCGECVNHADCKAKEDGNLCNGTLYCEKQGHTCVVDAATVVQCPAPVGGGAACIVAACDAKSGKCAIAPANEGVACDDSNACTAKDACKKGICSGTYGTLGCDDANPCTQDICDPAAGCTSTGLDGVACNDGNVCSQGDVCATGKCKGGGDLGCDDGNPCTTDGCNPGKGCVHNVNTLVCSDGNVCTIGDVCLNAVCTPKAPLDCDDSNICTADQCDAKTGCAQQPANGIQCNDGNACTAADKCTSGQCLGGGQLPCSDGNVCTNDGCDAKSGCAFTPNAANCNDGNACTDNDACQGGGCKSGKPSDCNDSNTCTVDLCDPAKGCIYQKVVDTTPCNDGDACTVSDKCSNAICLAGTKLGCNDSEVCTTDSCAPKTGCVYTPFKDGDPCNDNNACTLVDACAKGKCTGTGIKDLDEDGHIDSKCVGGDDCDDTSAKAYPGLKEVCDDLDNDCKAGVDDGCDDDNDDWCDGAMTVAKGVVPKTCAKGGGDCDDTKNAIWPGAQEKLEVDLDHRVWVTTPLYTMNHQPAHAMTVGSDGTVYLAAVRQTWPSQRLFVYSRPAGQTVWTVASIDDTLQATGPAMAVDALGQPHVVYQDLPNKTLRHAWRTGKGWLNESIDNKKGVGEFASMAVAPVGPAAGTLHVAYYDPATGDLRHATNGSGTWVVNAIDTENDVGQYTAIGTDKTGAAHIVYLDYTNQDLRYATDAGTPGKFTAQVVDGVSSAAGFYASLAVDSSGSIHAAYYELVASDLKYAVRKGGSWQIETVDAAGTVGQFTSIAVDAGSTVHIGYLDVDKSQARLVSGKAGSWTKTTLETMTAGSTARVGVTAGNVLVSYLAGQAGGNQERLRMASKAGGSPAYTWVDSGLSSSWCSPADGGFVGPRMGKVPAGHPIVVGMTPTAQILGRWLGTSYEWRVFQGGKLLQPGSMALAADGTAHVCGTLQGGGLGYLTSTWTGPPKVMVPDASAKSGNPCSIALDGKGNAHMTYYDAGNQVMRLVSVQSGVSGTPEIPDPSFGTGAVQDLAFAPDGSLVLVYGGKNLRAATRVGTGPWKIETVLLDAVNEVAMAIDPGGTIHVLFRTPAINKLRYIAWQKGAWGQPVDMPVQANGSSPSGLGLTLDDKGKLHAAVFNSTGYYMTNRFGSWSANALGLSTNSSQPGNIVLGEDDRVHGAGYSGGCTQEGGVAVTLTWKNLVDDDCDGK